MTSGYLSSKGCSNSLAVDRSRGSPPRSRNTHLKLYDRLLFDPVELRAWVQRTAESTTPSTLTSWSMKS
jgi:hypothetical protein